MSLTRLPTPHRACTQSTHLAYLSRRRRVRYCTVRYLLSRFHLFGLFVRAISLYTCVRCTLVLDLTKRGKVHTQHTQYFLRYSIALERTVLTTVGGGDRTALIVTDRRVLLTVTRPARARAVLFAHLGLLDSDDALQSFHRRGGRQQARALLLHALCDATHAAASHIDIE